MILSPREYSEARLHSVLEEIDRLRESDFPYAHSREALDLLRGLYAEHLSKLRSLPPSKDAAIVNGFCREALLDIFRYFPFLGFILRATNVRNAFEVHGPLLRLCKEVIGPDAKLILSSEWNFSPFTFPEQRPLPNFVLIGLPASETDNPLLLPLAGHELGHTIWGAKDFEAKYYGDVERNIIEAIATDIVAYQKYFPNHQVNIGDKFAELNVNIFVKRTIASVVTLALSRAQEYFCDCTGVYLFDEAFLNAFAYLVSPSIGCPRSPNYPNNLARIQNMINAAEHFRKTNTNIYNIPPNFASLFEDSPEAGDAEQKYLSGLADLSSTKLCPALILESESLLKSVSAPQLTPSIRDAIIEEFKIGVPAGNAENVTNILNAGWAVYRNTATFWPNIPDQRQCKRVLSNLMIKNIELLEIEYRRNK